MRNTDPGQDQESRVVRDEADVASSRLPAPADIAVATADVARRRRPCHAADRPTLRPYHVLQVLAHWLFVAQIVILLHQAIGPRLMGAASYLLELDGLEISQSAGYGRTIYPSRCRSRSVGQRIVANITHRRHHNLPPPPPHHH